MTEVVYKNKWFNVTRETVGDPGSEHEYFSVQRSNEAAVILPVTQSGEFVLVKQYRPPVGRDVLEAPAGLVDPGEAPRDAARREMREETGYDLDSGLRLYEVGKYLSSPGLTGEPSTAFIALDCVVDEYPLSPDSNEKIEVVKIPANINSFVGIEDLKTFALIQYYLNNKGRLFHGA